MMMGSNSLVVTTIAAQHDNLGDIVIRRKLLQWLEGQDVEVYVYVGNMPKGYKECFPGGESFQYYTSGILMLLKVLQNMIIGGNKVHFVLPPGPAGGASSIYGLMKVISNYIMYFLSVGSGGGLHSVGRAYRGTGWVAYLIKKLALRSQTLIVRDPVANGFVEDKAQVEPDLGFECERVCDVERDLVAICIRSMPGLSAQSFEPLISAAKEVGLKTCFIVQVERDNEVAAEMANKLGVDANLWQEETHSERMVQIAKLYSRSALIVGNRLHGVILGMNNGAVPVALVAPGSDKLISTLSVVMDKVDSIAHEEMLMVGAKVYWEEMLRSSDIKRGAVTKSLEESMSRLDKVKNDFLSKL